MQIVGWYGWNFWYPAIFGVDDYESELKNRNSKCWTEVQKVDWFARKSILSVSFGVCDNEFKLKNRKVKMKHLKWWKVRPSYSFCHFDFTNLEFTFVITDPENPVAWFNLKKKQFIWVRRYFGFVKSNLERLSTRSWKKYFFWKNHWFWPSFPCWKGPIETP